MRFTFFIATFVASIALVSALPTQNHPDDFFGPGWGAPGTKRVEGKKADSFGTPYPGRKRSQDSEDWSGNGNEWRRHQNSKDWSGNGHDWKRGKISKDGGGLGGGQPSPTF